MHLKHLITDTSTAKPYSPQNHKKTINRRLIGDSSVPSERIELIFCELEPGGEAEWHFHSESEQLVYVLEGRCLVQALGEECILTPGMVVRFPENIKHRVIVLDDSAMKCLTIYSPPIFKSK